MKQILYSCQNIATRKVSYPHKLNQAIHGFGKVLCEVSLWLRLNWMFRFGEVRKHVLLQFDSNHIHLYTISQSCIAVKESHTWKKNTMLTVLPMNFHKKLWQIRNSQFLEGKIRLYGSMILMTHSRWHHHIGWLNPPPFTTEN